MAADLRFRYVAVAVLVLVLGPHVHAQEILTLQKVGPSISSIAFSPDGKALVITAGGRGCAVRHIENKWEPFALTVPINFVNTAVFSPDGKHVLAAGSCGNVKVWTVPGKESKEELPAGVDDLWGLTFARDGKTLVAGTRGKIRQWDFGKRTELKELKMEAGSRDGYYHAVAISPDGKYIAGAESRGHIDVFEADGTPYLTFKQVAACAVAFSPDGKMLASGGDIDATIKITDLATKKTVAELKGHEFGVGALVYTPAGVLISGGRDNTVTVRFWNVKDRKELAALKGHTRDVRALALSPDGATLASGDEEGTVKLWDVAKALK
jgi:WD40 repeat protein